MSTFEYVRKIANEVNRSFENGTAELTQAADILSSISARHSRMREIAVEVGALIIGAGKDLDQAGIETHTSRQALSKILEILKEVDDRQISPLNTSAVEADAALHKTPGKLDYHGSFIRREFDASFCTETEGTSQLFKERIALTAEIIAEAKDQQTAAVEVCRRSLEAL